MSSTKMPLRSWLAVFILAIATFTIVTTELAPVGLLTHISHDLGVTEADVGLTVSIYAWIGALSALFSSLILGNIPKRRLLVVLTIILIVANFIAAIASSYNVLFVARIIGAFAHGAFWAIIGASAASIVPPEYIGKATSIVFGGVSAASVLGVPLSNYIGSALTWNMAFGFMCFLSVVALIGILLWVPKIKAESSIGVTAMKDVLKNKSIILIYVSTLLAITAHFSAFTYIEPWLHVGLSQNAELIPVALLVFGVAGLVGNFLTGILIDQHLKSTVLLSLLLVGVILAVISSFSNSISEYLVFLLVILWGLGICGVFVGLQTWVLKLAGSEGFTASAIYVFCFNLAIGLGAVLGSWIMTNFSRNRLYFLAGCVTVIAIILVSFVSTSTTKDRG